MKRKNISCLFVISTLQNNLSQRLEKVERLFKNTDRSYEIVIIDNINTPRSYKELKKIGSTLKSTVTVLDQRPLPEAWAVKEALRYTSGDYIMFYDYNHDLDLKDLNHLLQQMEEENLDLIIGYKKGTEKLFHYSWVHRLVRKFYFLIINLLFGEVNKDIPPNVKIFKAPVLGNLLARTVAKTFPLGLELLIVANNLEYRVKSMPIELEAVEKYRHWVSLKGIYHALVEILAIYYRLKILKYYDREQTLPQDYPPVSIIIPVKEENRYLKECINACRQLDYPDFEIIVLPDKNFKLPDQNIRIIPTGNVSPPEKRDRGIENARGEIMAFLDSDAFPLSHWLTYGVRYFADPEIGAVGGPAVTPSSDTFWPRASGIIFSSFIVGGNCKFRYAPMPHREVEDYPSCNLLVRKSVLKTIKGFNTVFYPGDDTFLCFKIIHKAKKKIIYDPDVLVFHHRRSLFFKHFRQLANYALHRGYFVRKFPQTSRRLPYFLPSLLLITVLVMGLLTAFLPFIRTYYITFLAIYGLLVLLTPIATMDYKLIPAVFLGIIATHVTYGLWFIKGLLARKMPEETSGKKVGQDISQSLRERNQPAWLER